MLFILYAFFLLLLISSGSHIGLLSLLVSVPVTSTLNIFFYPEDGSSKFIRNSGKDPPDYAA
jgi:hypothetical protein